MVPVGIQRVTGSPRHCSVLGRSKQGSGGGSGGNRVGEGAPKMGRRAQKTCSGGCGPARRNGHTSHHASELCFCVISQARVSTPGGREEYGSPPPRKCLQGSWGNRNRNSRRQKVVSAGGDTQPGPQNKTGVTHPGSVAGSAVSWLRDHGAHMSIELACVQSPLWSWSGTEFGKWWPMSRIWPTTMLLCGLIAKNSSYTFKWLVAGNQRNILCHMKIV